MKSKKGFTLIELMIVVSIIGVLSSVAIPKFQNMVEKAREGATKGNIGALKSAISIYYSANAGYWPQTLTSTTIFLRKYIDKIPMVKVTHYQSGYKLSGTGTTVQVVLVTASIATNTDGWKYNRATGDVWVRNSQTDTKGTRYSMYGYE